MQRLFSTFAGGWPGAGLLLLRAVIGIVSIDCAVMRLCSEYFGPSVIVPMLTIGIGLLLIAGLWTPLAGTLLAALAVWTAFLHSENLLIYILIGSVGAALAMIGPGAWSVDARMFGRKQIFAPKD
ncbi:MAG: hypothetical protein ABSE46_18620 [Terracidiphilus sp.]